MFVLSLFLHLHGVTIGRIGPTETPIERSVAFATSTMPKRATVTLARGHSEVKMLREDGKMRRWEEAGTHGA